jgi:hypothetical protein
MKRTGGNKSAIDAKNREIGALFGVAVATSASLQVTYEVAHVHYPLLYPLYPNTKEKLTRRTDGVPP